MQRLAAPTLTGAPKPNGRARWTVLVVDDEPSIRTWLTRSLESLSYVVVTAPDNAIAETILAATHVDAIILDLRVGDQSGLDLLSFVRGRQTLAPLPVLLLTGSAQMTEDEEETIRSAGVHVFYKPAALAEIDATLRRLLV